MPKDTFLNGEGYPDPTAYHGLKSIIKEEQELEKRVHDLVHIVRNLSDIVGFEVVGRIHFRHKKTGRDFK